MLEINKIHCMDCLEGLKQLPDNSVDLVVTDPPYNIAKDGDIFKIGNNICSTKDSFGHYDIKEREHYLLWMEEIIIELQRICKDGANILIFLGREYVNIIEQIFIKYNFKCKNTISIVKRNPLPHFRHNGFRSGFELGLWLCKGEKPKTFNFLQQSEMINYDIYTIGQKDSTHPNEKPLDIIKKYVKVLSEENMVVCDPFMGSGTTAVACKELGRNFIGFEISEEYCNIANKRLNSFSQLSEWGL
jgi:site-specific DNA-methyltransferase (adenine-specific)